MAKIKFGSLVVSGSGKIGGHKIGRNNGTSVLQNNSVKSGSKSNAQVLQRKTTQLIMQLYSSVDGPSKIEFENIAKEYSKTDIFGSKVNFTGFGIFQKLNQGFLSIGESAIISSPIYHIPKQPLQLDVNASTTEIFITSDEYTIDECVVIYASKSLSKGVSNARKFMRKIAYANGSELSIGIDILSEYEKVFGSLSVNDNIFFGFKTISRLSGFSNGELIIKDKSTVVSGIIPPVYDPDAQAFIAAIGTLNVTQEVAINDLVLGYKANNTWSKYLAIYPVIGGTADSHKYNLKNPLDTDSAFRLSFNGTVIHSDNGMVSNGADGYANTHLNASVLGIYNDTHLSYYSRTDDENGSTELGCDDGAATGTLSLSVKSNAFFGYCSMYSVFSDGVVRSSPPSSIGYFFGSRVSSTDFKAYRNGVQSGSNSNVGIGAIPNRSLYLMANHLGTGNAGNLSLKQCAFATIGNGLTALEVVADYNIVQTFQTALGRAI